MKQGPHRYKYAKQSGGKGKYGEVEIEIKLSESESTVVDSCPEWYEDRYGRRLYINKIWKQNAIACATEIISLYDLLKRLEVNISDVSGENTDTLPSHIGAATAIGLSFFLRAAI